MKKQGQKLSLPNQSYSQDTLFPLYPLLSFSRYKIQITKNLKALPLFPVIKKLMGIESLLFKNRFDTPDKPNYFFH